MLQLLIVRIAFLEAFAAWASKEILIGHVLTIEIHMVYCVIGIFCATIVVHDNKASLLRGKAKFVGRDAWSMKIPRLRV